MGRRFNNLPRLRSLRKALRNSLTPAEAKLWTILQRSQLDGRKFRRQHSIGRYIVDFYCPAERLVVELDGAAHNSQEAQEYDRQRDLFLHGLGIKVLRFENRLVLEQPEAVIEMIRAEFGTEPPRPSATPPCEGGER